MTPQELHLAINHIPVVGALWTWLLLVISWFRPVGLMMGTALVFVILVGVSSWAAYSSGERAEEEVEHLPGVVEEVLEKHEDLSKLAMIAGVVAGLAGLAGLLWLRTAPENRLVLLPALLTLSLAIVLLGMAAHAGGRIHRPELSDSSTSASWLHHPTR